MPRTAFNACGRSAIADMRAANMRRTMMGSVAMGNAHPADVKTAIYGGVTRHLRGELSDSAAAAQLRQAIAGPARSTLPAQTP